MTTYIFGDWLVEFNRKVSKSKQSCFSIISLLIAEGNNSGNDCTCSISTEDISSEDQPLKSTVITPREASKLLVDIEGFFVSRGLHEEASIAHKFMRTAADISKKEMK